MSRLDALSPDQRAVLQLVLERGKRYDELGTLLRIEPAAVRGRAVAALSALGPRDGVGADLPEERRGELTDHLLGQQPPAAAERTRALLADSPDARAWARTVAAELRPLAGDRLPALPGDVPAASLRSSRLGGALLIGAVAIVLAGVIAWAVTSSGGGSQSSASTGTTTPATTTATTQQQPQVIGQVNLKPPSGGGKALGAATILEQAGQREIALQAQGLPASSKRFAYAVWLTNAAQSRSRFLGFGPAVGKDGRLQGVATLPSGAGRYTRLVLTRETSQKPKKPGDVVLTGRFTLPGQG